MNLLNCTKTLKGHSGNISCLIRLNEYEIASGGLDYIINIWNLEKGSCVKKIINHKSPIRYIVKINEFQLVSVSAGGEGHIIKINNIF